MKNNLCRFLTILVAVFFIPTAALAIEASVEKAAKGDRAAAWAAIGDFCAISKWHPVVTGCVFSAKDGKAYRELTLGDGGKILEQLIEFDPVGMSYTYIILESPLPVKNYRSTMAVTGTDSAPMIKWSGTFDGKDASDADAKKVMEGVYDAGVSELVK